METGGDDTAIVDQDPGAVESTGRGAEESGWAEEDQGVARQRKDSQRRRAGILGLDTWAAAGFDSASRRKSSASSVGDFRGGATHLNPQVSPNLIRIFIETISVVSIHWRRRLSLALFVLDFLWAIFACA